MTTTPKKFVHSKPVYTQSVSFNSSQVQRVVKRHLAKVTNALFSTDVILRIIGDEAEIDQLEELISEQIKAVKDDFKHETERLEKLMEDAGINEMPNYTNPTTINVQIKSPQTHEFIQLLSMLDELMGIMDCLWLNAILTSKQRTDASYQWQQRLMRLAGRIIGYESRARASARNQGVEEEVNSQVPEEPTNEQADSDTDFQEVTVDESDDSEPASD